MIAGTSLKPKNININDSLNTNITFDVSQALVAFHCLTGCDVTSFFYGVSKKAGFKVLKDHYILLKGIGNGELTKDKIRSCEQFICRMYRQNNVNSVDKLRTFLFSKSKVPEQMPPNSDAFLFHLKRTHYQAMLWKAANVPMAVLPAITEMGWTENHQGYEPILTTIAPIPDACI